MPASVIASSPALVPSVSRRLTGAAVAYALLLQAVLAVPLAVRMAADVLAWARIGVTVCAHADEAGANGDRQPIGPAPAHDHGQCQVCQAHAGSFGLLLVLLAALAVAFDPVALCRRFVTGASPRHGRDRPYLSRAPPGFP